MDSRPLPVLIVDDDPAIRKALARLLRMSGWLVKEFKNGEDLLARTTTICKAGCVILDVDMPKVSGLEVQAELQRKGIHLPIIFLTAHGNIPMGVQAIKSGAVDFLSKPCDADTLIQSVQDAVSKQRDYLDNQHARAQELHRLELLTPREKEVMHEVARGKMNKEIAGVLGIAEKTVKIHRGHMMKKLQLTSVAELVHLLVRHTHDGAQ